MKQNVLLINPPYYRLYKSTYSLDRYPLSLGYLSGVIKENTSWDVMVYNADFCSTSEPMSINYLTGKGFENFLKSVNDINCDIWNEVKNIIKNYQPTVIGITSMTQNFKCAYNIAKIAKKIAKDICIIMGGPHTTLLKTEVLDNYQDIDICVIGEGEKTIVDLLNVIEQKAKFDNIKGIIYRENEKIHVTERRELITNIDILPFPYKYAPEVLKDFEQYPTQAFQHIFTIRGCPYNCIFCGSRYLWGRTPRYRSIDNIMSEIQLLVNSGLNSIIFEDDTFGIKESFILEICENIKKHYPEIEWACEMHVNNVNEKIISAMKSSGCRGIIIGIESGNNIILDKIRKKTTIEACYKAAKIIKKYKIYLSGFFMVGFPWETEKTLKDTMKAIKKIKCFHSGYSIFTPYKGTEAFDICRSMGLIKDDFDFSLYHHQSPLNCFCSIPKAKFRKMCSKIENIIDKANRHNQLKDFISFKTISKIRKHGLRNSIKIITKILGF